MHADGSNPASASRRPRPGRATSESRSLRRTSTAWAVRRRRGSGMGLLVGGSKASLSHVAQPVRRLTGWPATRQRPVMTAAPPSTVPASPPCSTASGRRTPSATRARPRCTRARRPPVRPGADDLDEHVERRLPALPRPGAGQPGHRRRRPRVRRLRAGRHRRDGRALARSRRSTRSQRRIGELGRHHHDAADRGRRVGRRRAGPPVRAAAVVVHAHRHRRQPVGDPARPAGDRAAEDPGLRLLLPRLGRRGVRRARPRRRARSPAPGNVGAPVAAGRDHPGRGVQRPRGRRARSSRTATSRRSSPSRR